MSQGFSIVSVDTLDGETKRNGQPVYKVKVKSQSTGDVYSFDDRWGSWITSKADTEGNRKEPAAGLATAMRHAVQDAIRKGTVGLDTGIQDVSPFKDPEPPPIQDNIFLIQMAAQQAGVTLPKIEDNPFMNLGEN